MSIDAIPTAAAQRSTTVVPVSGKTIYTCPMHPEVQQSSEKWKQNEINHCHPQHGGPDRDSVQHC
jgi:hypothetical protein